MHLLISVIGKFRGLFSLPYKFRNSSVSAWKFIHWPEIWYCTCITIKISLVIVRLILYAEYVSELINKFPIFFSHCHKAANTVPIT